MEDLFLEFLDLEPHIIDPEVDKLAFLDRGYLSSKWATEIDRFDGRLKNTKLNNYPDLGVVPKMNLDSLSFLHGDIANACLCVINDNNDCFWFGRNPDNIVQMWSATKFLPIYYLLSNINVVSSGDTLSIKDQTNNRSFPLQYLVDLVFTYDCPDISSNSLALMFKSFYDFETIEAWLHRLTGNYSSIFRGGYGEPTFVLHPVLQKNNQDLLEGSNLHQGQNLMSAYDLTRILSHLAWIEDTDRYHVLIQGMAKDSARYLDIALNKRSLTNLSDVVILSKMGFGRSEQRNQSELVYTALLSSNELRFCLTYKATLNLSHPAQEARHLDARMATEVTKTIEWLSDKI